MESPWAGLEEQIDYCFAAKDLLVRALTHRSSVSDKAIVIPDGLDNEPLEFLGDAVLGFVVSEALLRKFPAAREGQLSQWKSHLVSATHLHQCALAISLGDYLVLGKGEERNGGRERKTLLANAMEALIAAIHLDRGLAPAQAFIERRVLSGLGHLADDGIELLNHKSVLQERTQALGLPAPRYATVSSAGPQHARIFTVEARVGDRLTSRANGSSKKTASQQAAELMIQKLNEASESGDED
jgi:ribonuclease III